MEKEIGKIVEVSALLMQKETKLTKMEGADKNLVIKAMKELVPIANAYDEFLNITRDKLKPENFDEMQAKAQQWQAEGEKTTLTNEERIEINTFFAEYQKSINECIKEEIHKKKELTYTPLSEDAFAMLMASNPEWSLAQIMSVEDMLLSHG